MCYTFCPRTVLPQIAEVEAEVNVLGVYKDCYAMRSKEEDIVKRGQDGGAVTSLLAYALDEGIIDCAVVTSANKNWETVTEVATSYEELKRSAGTKYTVHPSVVGIRDAVEKGYEKIGFVGLPCQIQGIRKIETSGEPYDIDIGDKIGLLIGLFCMENFEPELLEFVDRSFVALEKVKKIDIKGKELLVYEYEKGERISIPLDEIKEHASRGCSVCTDFTSMLADISVGSVGSEDGWSTVFARTDRGEELVSGAMEKGFVEVKEIDVKGLGLIRRLAESKRKRGELQLRPGHRNNVNTYNHRICTVF
jgi:coenzyme F420 hydrogenase subunit beta